MTGNEHAKKIQFHDIKRKKKKNLSKKRHQEHSDENNERLQKNHLRGRMFMGVVGAVVLAVIAFLLYFR